VYNNSTVDNTLFLLYHHFIKHWEVSKNAELHGSCRGWRDSLFPQVQQFREVAENPEAVDWSFAGDPHLRFQGGGIMH